MCACVRVVHGVAMQVYTVGVRVCVSLLASRAVRSGAIQRGSPREARFRARRVRGQSAESACTIEVRVEAWVRARCAGSGYKAARFRCKRVTLSSSCSRKKKGAFVRRKKHHHVIFVLGFFSTSFFFVGSCHGK